MITQYQIVLGPVEDHRLFSDSAYRLYAYLLEQLSFEEADWLHESGVVCQFLKYEKEKKRYLWTLNLLSDETAQVLRPVLEDLKTVSIENQVFPVLDQTMVVVGLEDLLNRGRERTDRRTIVQFCTLTAFLQQSRHRFHIRADIFHLGKLHHPMQPQGILRPAAAKQQQPAQYQRKNPFHVRFPLSLFS